MKEKKGKLLESFVIAISMYSRIPMPQIDWTEQGMKYALCFFPIVGVVIGAVVSVYGIFVKNLLGPVAWAAVGTCIPILISGGIHMDGFLDTMDARSSFGSLEKKLEILKDSHMGAFAAIGGFVYLLLYAAVFSELSMTAFPAAAGVFVLTRAMSGWSVLAFPKAKKEGLANTFSSQAEHRVVRLVLVLWAVLTGLFLLYFAGITVGLAMLAAALFVMIWYYKISMKEFGGVTGDLAGYFLQICELVLLGVLAVAGHGILE